MRIYKKDPASREDRVRRQRLLLLITVLTPLLLLLLAEGVLRVAGVGAREPLFVPVASAPGYLQPNEAVIQRFFPDPRRAPRVAIDTQWFPAKKPAGTFRIVVQGESSAAGFPYGRWASPAALLQQRLQRMYPGRRIEVINTGMAAVTSYVLLDFADEILALEPDAVVVYAGHNEYLGVGGVGSSYVAAKSPALARTVAALRHLHLYRALERLVSSTGAAPPAESNADGTLMSRVARERSIPWDSPLYRQGLAQFRGNLDRLLRRYRSAGVPVLVGTLASNERDQPPFVSTVGGEDSAASHYGRARTLDAAGRYEAARAEYVAARDRDELRFRAPTAFNATIREVAPVAGAVVVEVERAFVAASRDGIVGADLMLEHVHPNVDGYFVLATAFVPALTAQLGVPQVAIDDATARREIPVTEIDRLAGEYRLQVLRNDWPFVERRRAWTPPPPASPIESLAQAWFNKRLTWADTMTNALSAYQQGGNTTEAVRVAVNLAEALVVQDNVQYAAGHLLLRSGAPERALPYLRRALQLNREPIEYALSLAEAQARAGQPAESVRTLEAILAAHPGEPRAQYWLSQLKK